VISNATCLLFLSQSDLILCFYTDNTVHLFWLRDTFTCFTLYILVKYSDIYTFHHLFLITSFSSFCHQAKYLQSKIQTNSNVFLILVACSTTFTSASTAIPKIGTSFEIYISVPKCFIYFSSYYNTVCVLQISSAR